MNCYFCKKPIGMNEGYYTFDLNIGAAASAAGNYAHAHSACGNPLYPDLSHGAKKLLEMVLLEKEAIQRWLQEIEGREVTIRQWLHKDTPNAAERVPEEKK